jgi:hypothetical protein
VLRTRPRVLGRCVGGILRPHTEFTPHPALLFFFLFIYFSLPFRSKTPAPFPGCIAICADNSPPYVAAMLAAVLVESIIVPIHPVLDTPSLAHVLAKTTPRVFFVGEAYADKLEPSLVGVSHVFVLPKKLTQTGTNSRCVKI